jgi:uncharacterized peroxidase-related enzyme
VQSHAHDLREEVTESFKSAEEADAFVEAIASDWRSADLSDKDWALCLFAEKLTQDQRRIGPGDLDSLRVHGFEDTAIHDATQIVGYFNYITRIADALGVEPESDVGPWGLPKP